MRDCSLLVGQSLNSTNLASTGVMSAKFSTVENMLNLGYYGMADTRDKQAAITTDTSHGRASLTTASTQV